jgi:small subunit ribosomal protein S1
MATDDVPAPDVVQEPPAARGGSGDPHQHRGVVTGIEDGRVSVALGPKTRGVLPLAEFDEPPAIGAEFEFGLESIQDGVWTLTRREARAVAAWQGMQPGAIVRARVFGHNSGGLEVKVGPVSAFIPGSEIGLHRVADTASFVGQEFDCEVLEVVRRKKRVVLSRRAVLRRESKQKRAEVLGTLHDGAVVTGVVEKLMTFGAFVDIGSGLSGLLHVSNISHGRVEDPATVLKIGQQVEVQILEIKNGGRRIGLGMKQLQRDPWDAVHESFAEGDLVDGKVLRVTEFGAFVELVPGVEGLLHKSRLSPERVGSVEEVVKPGDPVKVRICSIDAKERKVSLSRLSERGAIIGSPEDEAAAAAGATGPERAEQPERAPRREPAQPAVTNLGKLLSEAMAKKKG